MKGYTAVSAISEAFEILQTGVVDQQQRDQMEAIKAQLTALEDGTPDVIDIQFSKVIHESASIDEL